MCATRVRKIIVLTFYYARAFTLRLPLEIYNWDAFGQWFGKYLGNIWGLRFLYIFPRLSSSVFFHVCGGPCVDEGYKRLLSQRCAKKADRWLAD